MAKHKRTSIEANRTVTVTILARHAFNLAQSSERIRMDCFKSCGEEGARALKTALKRHADEWGETSDILASAYEASLCAGREER